MVVSGRAVDASSACVLQRRPILRLVYLRGKASQNHAASTTRRLNNTPPLNNTIWSKRSRPHAPDLLRRLIVCLEPPPLPGRRLFYKAECRYCRLIPRLRRLIMIGLMIGLALRWRPAHISGSQSWIGGEGTSGLATSGSEPYHSQQTAIFRS